MYSSLLASVTHLLWNCLESYGCDSAALFEAAGLDPKKLYDANARYSYASARKLWQLAIEATQDPCLGLKAARFWHPTDFHGLGFAWMASSTLKDALSRAIRYFRIVTTDPERLSLQETKDCFKFVIDTSSVQYRGLDEEYDLLMAVFVEACRNSYGPDFCPLRVTMERARPACAEEFVRYFRAPVAFSAPQLTLSFGKAELNKPLPTANIELARASDQVVTAYLAQLDRSDIVMQVKGKLIQHLSSGEITEEAIADALTVSPRSLQRKLREEGTTYKQLLDETRRELATQYVPQTQLSIKEITYLLGFSEPANFSRAFRRWEGMSPSQYRSR